LQVAGPVEDIHDLALRAIVADMYETMHAANGVGLAAPQIGVGLRLMIFGFNENQRYPNEKPVPVTTLINPWLEVLSVGAWHARASPARDAHPLRRHAGRRQRTRARG